MKYHPVAAVMAAALTVSACATTYTMTPYPTGAQTVRYVQGQPTIYAEGRDVSIQVTPLSPNEKGRLVYVVAALNRGEQPFNFGAENVSLTADGAEVRVFTYAELERMAKNDATMALVITALAGAGAAYAASSGPTSRSTTYTPFGTYQTVTTNHAAQAVAGAVAAAQTTAQMGAIADNLDSTIANLSANVLQTTTIDPAQSFGGQIIGDRVSIPDEGELDTRIVVRVGDEEFLVRFGISKQQ